MFGAPEQPPRATIVVVLESADGSRLELPTEHAGVREAFVPRVHHQGRMYEFAWLTDALGARPRLVYREVRSQ